MNLIAVDPGSSISASAEFVDGRIVEFAIRGNGELVRMLGHLHDGWHLAIETLHPRGMPTAQEEMEMQLWAGACIQEFCGFDETRFTRMKRSDVKMTICGHPRAKDSNIRQALIERYGGKDQAIGRKKTPGPLYGAHDDIWSAIALGHTWLKMRGQT